MTDPNGAIYGVPWIPSIYPSHVSIYISTMDPSWDMRTMVLEYVATFTRTKSPSFVQCEAPVR